MVSMSVAEYWPLFFYNYFIELFVFVIHNILYLQYKRYLYILKL